MKPNKRLVLSVSVIAIIGLVVFLLKQNTPRVLRVGMVEWAGFYPLVCAVERGDFKKSGLDVKVQICPDNPSCNSAIEKGEMDIIGLTLGDLLMINASQKIVRVFYVADQSGEGDAIVGKAEIKTPQDLRGKIISIEKVNSFSHMFVLQFLHKYGLTESDVRFKDVAAADVLKELMAGRIDAGHTWDPTKAEAIKNGYRMIGSAADVPGAVMDLYGYNARQLRDRHEDIVEFTKILGAVPVQGWTSSTEECVKLVAAFHKKTPEQIIESYPGVIHKTPADQSDLIGAHATGDLTLRAIGNFIFEALKKSGQITTSPDYDFIFDPTITAESVAGQ